MRRRRVRPRPLPRIARRFFADGKPVLIYDDQCAFCRRAVASWRAVTRGAVRYVPIHTAVQELPAEVCAACQEAIHLFTLEGGVYRGAHAVLKTLATGGRYRWILWLYEHVPGVRLLAEALYRFVSSQRMAVSRGVTG